MDKYFSVLGEYKTVKIIERSRFVTTSRHVEGEEQAKSFISEISSQYADATHNCYAYIADDVGNFLRFSDNGEPQGTAGMPILDVIKNKKLCQTAVVVSRWFGGIKLGAGGLVRAYSGCAAENLEGAQRVLYELCAQSEYTVDYPCVDAALRFFGDKGADILDTRYENDVTFTAAIKKCGEVNFNSQLTDALNGRIRIRKIKEYFFPFKI